MLQTFEASNWESRATEGGVFTVVTKWGLQGMERERQMSWQGFLPEELLSRVFEGIAGLDVLMEREVLMVGSQ